VATLSREMCAAVMPVYARLAALSAVEDRPAGRGGAGGLPDVVVFDADTYCAMDASARFAIPRVARVGTGPRDPHTTPWYVPQYGAPRSGVGMSVWSRLANAASLALATSAINPLLLPWLMARDRNHWRTVPIPPVRWDSHAFTAAAGRELARAAATAGCSCDGAEGNVAASVGAAVVSSGGGADVTGAGESGRCGEWCAALVGDVQPQPRPPRGTPSLSLINHALTLLGVPVAPPGGDHAAVLAVATDGDTSASRRGTGTGGGGAIAAAMLDVDWDVFRPHLPWDGVPTLFNTHWGLEYARPLHPYEHLTGHTTDFAFEAAKQLPPVIDAWLSASDTPVVYVGLGTLSILPPPFIRCLVDTLASSAPHGSCGRCRSRSGRTSLPAWLASPWVAPAWAARKPSGVQSPAAHPPVAGTVVPGALRLPRDNLTTMSRWATGSVPCTPLPQQGQATSSLRTGCPSWRC
jgi:hypothetical protein